MARVRQFMILKNLLTCLRVNPDVAVLCSASFSHSSLVTCLATKLWVDLISGKGSAQVKQTRNQIGCSSPKLQSLMEFELQLFHIGKLSIVYLIRYFLLVLIFTPKDQRSYLKQRFSAFSANFQDNLSTEKLLGQNYANYSFNYERILKRVSKISILYLE